MKLNQLPAVPGAGKSAKRKGRGPGSGNGKTGGRGHKGQKARSGGYHRVGFEGGQMPLQRRLPKRGFRNRFKKIYALIKVQDLEAFDANAEVTLEALQAKGLVGKIHDGVKLLGDGELTKPLTVHVAKASQSAIAKVEAAGGSLVGLQAAEPADSGESSESDSDSAEAS